MQLTLEEIIFKNFCGGDGHYKLTQENEIYAANGKGKTRWKDAYSWVLTGRNSANQAKFDIKDYIHPEKNSLPHYVGLHFRKQDGEKLTLEKELLELRSGKKGEVGNKVTGHTTNHMINGVPKTETQFNELLSAMIPAARLKVLSDPLYFPEVMKWTEQRDVLQKMAIHVTPEYVVEQLATPEKDFAEVIAIINAGQTVEDKQARVKYEITETKKKLNDIQPKITENSHSIDQIGVVDEPAVKKEIERLEGEIAKIDVAIRSKTEAEDLVAEGIRDKRKALGELKNSQLNKEQYHQTAKTRETNERTSGISSLEDQISNLETQKRSKTNLVASLSSAATTLATDLEKVVSDWQEMSATEFPEWDPNNFICPACKRKHDAADIEHQEEELRNAFLKDKESKQVAINGRGERVEADIAANKKSQESAKTGLDLVNKELDEANEKLETLKKANEGKGKIQTQEERLAADTEYQGNLTKIADLEAEIAKVKPVDFTELKTKKAELNTELDTQKAILNRKTEIKRLQDRNLQLAEDQKKYSQAIADLQKVDMEIDEFVIGRMEVIEKTIRSKFDHVRFIMFDTNIGDGTIKPWCEAWYEGKPFSALNTAAKLNAGLDIINGLARHYGVRVPILLDNRESVSVIIPVDSQVISFFVSPADEVLRLVNK